MLLNEKLRIFVAIVLAGSVVGFGTSVAVTPATTPIQSGSYESIWADPGTVTGRPSVSMDGRLLALMEPLTSALSVLDLETGVRRRYDAVSDLSPRGSEVSSIAISRDELAFIRSDTVEQTSELAVISLDGASERVLLAGSSGTRLEVFAWTSTGELVVSKTEASSGTVQILLVSSLDGAQTALWNRWSGAYVTSARPSPDSDLIAISVSYVRDGFASEVVLLERQTETSTVLMERGWSLNVLGWDRAGGSILVAEAMSGGQQIHRLAAAGPTDSGDSGVLGPRDVPFGVSWDGSILISRTRPESGFYFGSVEEFGGELVVRDARLLPAPVSLYRPTWSRAGNRFVTRVTQVPGGVPPREPEQWVIVDGQTLEITRTLTLSIDTLQLGQQPTWSRDDGFLLFRAQDQNGRIGFYRVNAVSGEAEMLVAQPLGYEFSNTADWTAEGTSIVYPQVNVDSGTLEVMEYDLSRSEVRTLHSYEDVDKRILFSPSGEAFLFRKTLDRDYRRRRHTFLIQTLGGPLVDTGFVSNLTVERKWSRDGRTVFVRARAVRRIMGAEVVDDRARWWRVHLDGKEPEILDFSIPGLDRLSFQPQSTGLIFGVLGAARRLEILSLRRPFGQDP